MTTSDDPYREPVPDTAMATGNDDGEPGEQPDERPLGPDKVALRAEFHAPLDGPLPATP